MSINSCTHESTYSVKYSASSTNISLDAFSTG